MSSRAAPAPPNATLVVPVVDLSQVGEARRAATGLAARSNFSETRAGELAILVTELANNLVKHGGGGEILLRPIPPRQADAGGGRGEALPAGAGIEVLSLDRGIGISNLNGAMRDGYSTAGTPGTGLGAVRRLAASFDMTSTLRRGTAIVARIWPDSATRAPLGFEIGAVCVPVRGETECGDAWCVERSGGRTLAILADGLGHGPAAAKASQAAVLSFRENVERSPQQIVEAIHLALRPTRGAAVSIAEIDPLAGRIRFCGVGNIASALVTSESRPRNLLTHNGTVGAEARRIHEVEEPWRAGSLLLLCSDGVTSRWQLSDYPGLTIKHPSLVAGVVYRDHLRGRDDATVLALRDVSISAKPSPLFENV